MILTDHASNRRYDRARSMVRQWIHRLRGGSIQALPQKSKPDTPIQRLYQRLENAASVDGLDAAEQIRDAHEAKLWARLADLAEFTDPVRALEYARRATKLTNDPRALRKLVRISRRLGQIHEPEALLERAVEEWADLATPADHASLERIRTWRRLLECGYQLPPRAADRPMEPVQDRIVYCLNNSLPFDSGGYATRSHGLLSTLQSAGMSMIAYTRLGYPWDQQGIRDTEPLTEIPEENHIDSVTYRRLRGNGLAFRKVPHDQYVDAFALDLERVVRLERPMVLHAASFR